MKLSGKVQNSMKLTNSFLTLIIYFIVTRLYSWGKILIGVKCSNGVILASDVEPFSTSQERSIRSCRVSARLTKLTDSILVGIADGDSSFSKLFNFLKFHVRLGKYLSDDDLDVSSVSSIARQFITTQGLHLHIAIAGISSGQYFLFEIVKQGTLLNPDIVGAGRFADVILSGIQSLIDSSSFSGDTSQSIWTTEKVQSCKTINEIIPLLRRRFLNTMQLGSTTSMKDVSVWIITDQIPDLI
jgi:20S proteasome alpha/beta subunit